MRTDIITITRNVEAIPSQQWRWKQQDAANRRIVGASSEGFLTYKACAFNLYRSTGIKLPPLKRLGHITEFRVEVTSARHIWQVKIK